MSEAPALPPYTTKFESGAAINPSAELPVSTYLKLILEEK